MPIIRFTTEVEAPPGRVFDLARDIGAHLESMRRHRERVVGGRPSGLLEAGEEVEWRARHFGLPLRLRTRIVELEPPVRFVDEQVRGPFVSMRHEHTFEGRRTGTLMTDVFVYHAPLGPLGWLADALFLEWYMRRLLVSRAAALKRAAEAASPEKRADTTSSRSIRSRSRRRPRKSLP